MRSDLLAICIRAGDSRASIAHSQFPGLANRELALPMVMTKLMPPWLGLLTLAAVFSAEVSASDAILFMLSSSLSVDLYKTFLRPAASDSDLLFVGRLTAVAGALFGVLLAVAVAVDHLRASDFLLH